jgi:hypothetical protein
MITLATLEKASEQEVFNQAKKHLMTQNAQSVNDGTCLYRGPDGLKCVGGCFMGDDEYCESFEEHDWDMLIGKGLIPEVHSGLIRELQYTHDQWGPEKWDEQLRMLAERRGLRYA